MSARSIVIRQAAAGEGFAISVEPPAEWTDLARERPSLHEARRYAASLKIVHGWRVVDEAGRE